MEKPTQNLPAPSKIETRVSELHMEHRRLIWKKTDRLFAWLMLFQWIAGIAAAFLISPRTWAGENSSLHLHVTTAVVLGGLISLPPVFLGLFRPGRTMTRYTIAIAQMLTSALLIHLSGGRIETHFHVFGSLAFLSFYREWRVLVPATIVVAADHFLRGVYWPQSVYGIMTASPWRWLEHAGWVVFEDICLVISCLQSQAEMKKIAERTAELENMNQQIETKVIERTHDLAAANSKLESEMEERKKLETAMIQSEKMAAIGQLAGGVAHEINNPLGIILGFAQNVAKRIKPGDEYELPLRSIEREAVRCKNLVQDLLTFSSVGKSDKERTQLKDSVDGALSLVLAQTKVKSVDLIKEYEEVPEIHANRTQIQQIVVNLCNNAIDAMPAGGKLWVRLKNAAGGDANSVCLEVQDTGAGISPENQSKIFNPFFTTKEVGKGTGLGLSLVYEIVQKHNARISVESKVGQGSKFQIVFPRA